jgi:hypothetical protein
MKALKARSMDSGDGFAEMEAHVREMGVPVAAGHESIIFELEGLRQINPDYGNEKPKFELTGIPLVRIDYSRIAEALMEQGVGQSLTDEAVDGMAEFIFARMLGEVLAKRMKRVG